MSDITDILEGFEFVPSDGVPSITLDNNRRFYLNSSARRLLDVKPYDRLAVLYKASTQSLAVAKPYVVDELTNAGVSNYNVDKRHYMSARKFVNLYGFSMNSAPFTFEYDLASNDGGVFIFQLAEG